MTEQILLQRAVQSIALLGSDLFETVRRKLVNDLGMDQVGRQGQEQICCPRAELLAEVVTPDAWVVILDWLSSTRRGRLQTKRNYADDIRRVWAGDAQELGRERFALGICTPDRIRCAPTPYSASRSGGS
ncbi:hypothetical protein ACFYRC_26280 [Streptomyces sp. NPDC005279]|uniref:hypothetical protein n=1 Tax=Streptomyces sp. NPDC005279 TaxID=3364712 RepID=UPI00367D5691